MCGVTLKDRCKSEELWKRFEIEDVADVVRKIRLGWFGHLERKDEGDWVSACRNMTCRKCWKRQTERNDRWNGTWILVE